MFPSSRWIAAALIAVPLFAILMLPADGHAQSSGGASGKSAKGGKAAKKLPPEPPFVTGPMKVIVPYPAGSGVDLWARTMAPKLSERSGQSATVENHAGANGTIGTAMAAKAAGDARTLLVVPAGYVSAPLIFRGLAYDQGRDLAPVSLMVSSPLLLVVHPSLPVKSVRDLIEAAKAKSAKISFGSPGAGSLPHVAAELFKSMAGIRMAHVPYKGTDAAKGADAAADVTDAKVPVHFLGTRQGLPLVRTGKLRALGVSGLQRLSIAPEIPPIAASGLPGYELTNWYGMLVPSSTPADVVKRLSAAVGGIVQSIELKDRMTNEGMTAIGSSPDYFAKFLTRETVKYARVIQTAGIQKTQ